jgi:hypothetical protein
VGDFDVRHFVLDRYGPADIGLLRQRVSEGRDVPNTILQEEPSRLRLVAASVSELELSVPGASTRRNALLYSLIVIVISGASPDLDIPELTALWYAWEAGLGCQ